MNKLMAGLLAGAVVSASHTVRAEMLDMSTVTCAQLATMNEDDGAMFLIWLDGWLSGQSDLTTLDVEELTAQIDGIGQNCTDTPELSVMNAAKAYLEE